MTSKIAALAKKKVDRDAARVAKLQLELAAAKAELAKSRKLHQTAKSLKRKPARKPATAAKKRKVTPWTLEDQIRLTQISMDITAKDEKSFYAALYKRFGGTRTKPSVIKKAKAMDIHP